MSSTTARQNRQPKKRDWADRARRRMEAFCTNENDGKQNDENVDDDFDAFLERHVEASMASQSPENQDQDQDENNDDDDAGKSDAAAAVGSALRLAHAHVRFLKFFSFAKEEEEGE